MGRRLSFYLCSFLSSHFKSTVFILIITAYLTARNFHFLFPLLILTLALTSAQTVIPDGAEPSGVKAFSVALLFH